eukprot:12226877-Alexandrium_andersonii.AAC.1
MSASLVGSEMCIRDSSLAGAAWLAAAAPVAAGSLAGAAAVAAAAAASLCLLYTSDAADDM